VSPNLRDIFTTTEMTVALRRVIDLTDEAARMTAYTNAGIPVDVAKRLDNVAVYAAQQERDLFPNGLLLGVNV